MLEEHKCTAITNLTLPCRAPGRQVELVGCGGKPVHVAAPAAATYASMLLLWCGLHARRCLAALWPHIGLLQYYDSYNGRGAKSQPLPASPSRAPHVSGPPGSRMGGGDGRCGGSAVPGSSAWRVLSVLERWLAEDAEEKGMAAALAPRPWTKQVVYGAHHPPIHPSCMPACRAHSVTAISPT